MANEKSGMPADEAPRAKRQLATVIDLNKCIGCQTCTMACKNLWTSRPGTEHMRWANVSTHPGKGYPRDYEKMGGGFRGGQAQPGVRPTMIDDGDDFQYNAHDAFNAGKDGSKPVRYHPTSKVTGKDPEWGYNWDEDEGGGQWPNAYFFYLARMCNHCTHPACLEACPRNAISKREKDGIVLIDQERCHGYRFCQEACPYKAVYFNPASATSEKCILCFPRVEKRIANACNRQCIGRVRAFGYLDDKTSQVYKLVKKWKVALPLHPEYGTAPNIYYVPPMGPRAYEADGELSERSRIPLSELEKLFGPKVKGVLEVLHAEREKVNNDQGSELMDILVSRIWTDRLGGFTNAPLVSPEGTEVPK